MHLIKEKGFSTVYFVKHFANDKAKDSLYTNFPSFCKTFLPSSKVPKMKNVRNSSFKVTATGEKIKGVKFHKYTGSTQSYNRAFSWYEFDTENIPKEMLYVVVQERMYKIFDRHSNQYYTLRSFVNAFGIEIYAVTEKELKDYSNLPWKKVEDYILEQAKNYPATHDVENVMSESFSDLFELIKDGDIVLKKGVALDYYNKSVAAMAKKTKKREKDNLVGQVFAMDEIRSKVKLVRHVEDLVDLKEAFVKQYPIAAGAYKFDCVEDWQWYFDNKD
jgi:hypothetical protein